MEVTIRNHVKRNMDEDMSILRTHAGIASIFISFDLGESEDPLIKAEIDKIVSGLEVLDKKMRTVAMLSNANKKNP